MTGKWCGSCWDERRCEHEKKLDRYCDSLICDSIAPVEIGLSSLTSLFLMYHSLAFCCEIPFFLSHILKKPAANRYGFVSFLSFKYLSSAYSAFAFRYTVRSFCPFPCTNTSFPVISFNLTFTSSDTLHPVDSNISNIAFSLFVLSAARIFSISSSVNASFLAFSFLIASIRSIGFFKINSSEKI